MSKDRITLRGKAARSFVAALMIDSKGEDAAEGTAGPMKEEIEKQLTFHSVSMVKHPEPGCEIKQP